MLDVLAQAEDLAGFAAHLPEVLDILTAYAWRLREGQVRGEELTIKRAVSKEAEAYKGNSQIAVASRQMAASGVAVHPGERIRYVISEGTSSHPDSRVCALPLMAPDTPYDTEKYLELLCRAAETLLWHHGYDLKRLRAVLAERGV